MTDELPAYVSITFILTTFLTVSFLLYAVKQTVFRTLPAKILVALLAVWLFLQAMLSLGGFYLATGTFPPRIVLFGVVPALLLIIGYFVFFRRDFIDLLPLKTLTLLHVIRIPVELVLYWLFIGGLVPEAMTFEGRNFDIVSGVTAPFAYLLGFRGGRTNRTLLIAWNIFALILLINIVGTAIAAFPGPMQQIAFEQPNRAVLYYPFVWLPTVIVPIVLFSHLASLRQLFAGKTR